jgi:hypothetical protein
MAKNMKLAVCAGALALFMSLAPVAFDSTLIGSGTAFADRSSNANPNPNAGAGGSYGPGGRFGASGQNITVNTSGTGPHWGIGGPLGAKGGTPSGNAGANSNSDSGF